MILNTILDETMILAAEHELIQDSLEWVTGTDALQFILGVHALAEKLIKDIDKAKKAQKERMMKK